LKKVFVDHRSQVNRKQDGWLRERVGLVYFEDSDDDDYSDDDESVSSVIHILGVDGFHL